MAIDSEDLMGIGSSFNIVGAAKGKIRLRIFSILALRNFVYMATHDLMVLEILEKCNRLTRYVSS